MVDQDHGRGVLHRPDLARGLWRIGRSLGGYILLLLGVGLVIAGAGEVARLLGFDGSQRQLVRLLMLVGYGLAFFVLRGRRS